MTQNPKLNDREKFLKAVNQYIIRGEVSTYMFTNNPVFTAQEEARLVVTPTTMIMSALKRCRQQFEALYERNSRAPQSYIWTREQFEARVELINMVTNLNVFVIHGPDADFVVKRTGKAPRPNYALTMINATGTDKALAVLNLIAEEDPTYVRREFPIDDTALNNALETTKQTLYTFCDQEPIIGDRFVIWDRVPLMIEIIRSGSTTVFLIWWSQARKIRLKIRQVIVSDTASYSLTGEGGILKEYIAILHQLAAIRPLSIDVKENPIQF